MKIADLHVHSNNSDGSDSVENLVNELQKNKVEIFALTDHDTIAGIVFRTLLKSVFEMFNRGVWLCV